MIEPETDAQRRREVVEQVTQAWMRVPAPGAWAEQAACRGLADVFTADDLDDDTLATAQRICRSYPVLEQCAAYVDGKRLHGLWAGQWWNDGRLVGRPAA